jgi:hypothetical protein
VRGIRVPGSISIMGSSSMRTRENSSHRLRTLRQSRILDCASEILILHSSFTGGKGEEPESPGPVLHRTEAACGHQKAAAAGFGRPCVGSGPVSRRSEGLTQTQKTRLGRRCLVGSGCHRDPRKRLSKSELCFLECDCGLTLQCVVSDGKEL